MSIFNVLIVAIVFSFVGFKAYLNYNRKKDRDKINAALRMEEMRKGYKPGTYSSQSYKKEKRHNHHKDDDDFVPEFKNNPNFNNERNNERVDLKEGIDDLMTRINNLEVIMESEKNKGE
jgi:Tfp pilus assembly protein PilE